ncbi:zf-HC2 domain-containing protein [Jidongwangia harbinensis]|uniref:zf-HC2 domain-containing protein n=1 Tax=Jidongwangia harbinensis TaxID=2878561 RepID=UPI001CDA466B|nr:zf-HC2 domain-containing protein [Jidongwangia harbinensis]MCA2211847.1 zf-HC2 domain-containing protein [Jidongwangia harbinensis]
MAEDLSDGPHVADLLGLYYLDSLDYAQGDRIERHLEACAQCRAQAEETVETVAALALLMDDDRTGQPGRSSAPVKRDRAPGGTSRTGSDRPGGGRGVRPGRAETSRPGPSAPDRRPPVRRRRVKGVARLGVLLALALVVGGLAVGALVRGAGSGGGPVMTAAATAEDSATGVSMSVVATQQTGGVQVRASVDGLRGGTPYRLYAVSADGQVWPVADWTADGRVQEVTGNVPVDLSSLVFLSVSLSGDSPVVSVYLSRSDGPTPPPR